MALPHGRKRMAIGPPAGGVGGTPPQPGALLILDGPAPEPQGHA